jgi:hypothetical protein
VSVRFAVAAPGLHQTHNQGPSLPTLRTLGDQEAKIDDPAGHFKGKTIRVTGTVIVKDEQPQIEVDEPGQVEVV